MPRLAVRIVLLSCTVLGVLTAPALAQNREKAWELNPYVGYLAFDETQGQQLMENTWDLGFRFGYHWTKHHEVEFGFYGAATQDGEDIGLDIDLLGGQVNYDYNLFLAHRDKVVGLGTVGVGLVNVSSFGFVSDPNLVGDQVEFTYNFGVGIRLFGGPRSGFRFDLRRTHFSDEGVDINFYEATLGMTIVLGGA